MKQIVVKQGRSLTVEVQPSALQPGMVRVRIVRSCISPGTEMTSIASSGKTLLQRAMEQPDKAKAAIRQMAAQGVSTVLGKAQAKFSAEGATGYSAAGVVVEVAPDVRGFVPGDRVAVAGAQYANHAEEAVVPVNLAMKMPDGLSFDFASTVALGGIAMQGVRRAEAALGEFVVVVGCGVLGLLTVQMLRASGCRVIAVDLDEQRLAMAGEMGAERVLSPKNEDVVAKTVHYCGGFGADRVIITAATSSNEPLSQAFGMCRRKGRVVLVGVVGPEFNRNDMYEKELDFVVSTSYGPGRYDENYERFGQDYPYGYVRWTENRNMLSYLEMVARGTVRIDRLISGVFPAEQSTEAYDALNGKVGDKPLLLLFSYGNEGVVCSSSGLQAPNAKRAPSAGWKFPSGGILRVGIIGAGAFVKGTHIPNLKQLAAQYRITAVCNQTGLSSRKAAAVAGGECRELTDPRALLASSDVDIVLIGTRHNLHAELAVEAIRSGKGVFLEKPLCLTLEEMGAIEAALQEHPVPFMVGYNRRFAPLIQQVRTGVANRVNPLMIHYTMNAGYLPAGHWTQTFEGGGRIIGEGCHILDLFQSIVGSPAVSISVDAIRPATSSVQSSDNMVASLRYGDGSVCTLLYTGLGNSQYQKERMEVYCDQTCMVLEDYISLKGYGKVPSASLKKQDKGHLEEWKVFHEQVGRGHFFPIAWADLKETFLASFRIASAIAGGDA